MKKFLMFVPVLLLLMGFTATRVVDEKINRMLQSFHVSADMAQNRVLERCWFNYFTPPQRVAKAFLSYTVGDRIDFVQTVGAYVREFTESREFVAQYNEFRKSQMPVVPDGPQMPELPKTVAEMREERRKELEDMKVQIGLAIAQIESMTGDARYVAVADRKAFDETIRQYRDQLTALESPGNPLHPDNPEFLNNLEELRRQQLVEYDEQMIAYEDQLADQDEVYKHYRDEVAAFDRQYPVNDPNPMLRKWIGSFLDGTADVQYDATTRQENGRDIFVDAQFERKDELWKMAYRAGKEPMAVARSFAQRWLADLKH